MFMRMNGNHMAHMIGVLYVTGTKNPPYRIRVNMRGLWLANFGFTYGTPVLAIPQPDGFRLQVENANTANVTNTTDAINSSKLIHVGLDGKKHALYLNFANSFAANGLAAGDFLAARYEYGVIEARRLPPAQRYCVVGTRNHGAFLRLYGPWLNDAGFPLDGIVTVATSPGCVTLRVWDEPDLSYREVVKFARMQRYQLVQVQKNQQVKFIDMDSHMLNRAGLDSGDICGVWYEHRMITLFKPDLQKLGLLHHQGLLS